MNSPRFGLRVAGTLFILVSVAHLVRLLEQIPIMIGGRNLPLWMSGLGLVVSVLLGLWLWRLSFLAPAGPAIPPTAAAGR
jgi:hypothetical protein